MDPALLADLQKLCRERIAPMAQQLDREARFPHEHLPALAKLGLMGAGAPKRFGGLDLDTPSFMRVMEELAAACASTAITWGVHASVGTHPILDAGSAEQQQRWVPQLARGERLGAFALSEPGSASDAAGSMHCTAVRRGDEYVINGAKQWITNGQHAGVFILLAKTQPELRAKGISAFIVPRETPGLSIGKHEDKMGLRASVTNTIQFDDARLPADGLMGAEGDGFKVAMKALDASRIGVGAQALGLARAAVEHASAWCQEHPPGQGVQFQLADAQVRVEASRALVQRAAELRDAGKPFTREASMAKLYASETAVRAAWLGVQVRGEAMGRSDAERIFRDARVTTIYEGTSEIQRLVIARQLGLPSA